MAFNCPSCRRSLENTRRPTCPFCNTVIPAAIRGVDSASRLERLRHEARQRSSRGTPDDGRSPGVDAGFIDFSGCDGGGDCGG